jgi:hypothetical protein
MWKKLKTDFSIIITSSRLVVLGCGCVTENCRRWLGRCNIIASSRCLLSRVVKSKVVEKD